MPKIHQNTFGLMHSTRSTSRNGGLLLRGRRRGGLLYKGEEEGERPTYKGEGREEKTEKEKKGIPPPQSQGE